MSKYKVGDKVILTVSDVPVIDTAYIPCYMLNDNFIFSEQGLDEYVEPLSTYTEPLEAKIKRQAAEITRLLAENKELKEDFEKSKIVNLNAGQKEAWELARKIVDMPLKTKKGIWGREVFLPTLDEILDEIFKNTYPEAAEKVAEWEKVKGKICVGDVVRFKGNNSVEFCVTDILDDSFLYGINAEGGIYSDINIEFVEKTGKHIDIDGFLKQIGGNER